MKYATDSKTGYIYNLYRLWSSAAKKVNSHL